MTFVLSITTIKYTYHYTYTYNKSSYMTKKTTTNFMAQYIRFPNLNSPVVASFVNEKITLPNP